MIGTCTCVYTYVHMYVYTYIHLYMFAFGYSMCRETIQTNVCMYVRMEALPTKSLISGKPLRFGAPASS